jgi:hypothetical protein
VHDEVVKVDLIRKWSTREPWFGEVAQVGTSQNPVVATGNNNILMCWREDTHDAKDGRRTATWRNGR